MAQEAETGGERTEEATGRRLDLAREEGQIPRSRELTNFATAICGSVMLIAIGGSLTQSLTGIMRDTLAFDAANLADPLWMMTAFGTAIRHAIYAVMPIFAATIGVVFAASVALGGWTFTLTPMIPNFGKLNPLTGFGRLFGMHGLGELGKALLKCLVIGAVCVGVVMHLYGSVMSLGRMPSHAAMTRGAQLMGWAFVWLTASLALIAAVDVPLQLFEFHRNLRMTKQEIRDEAKDSEGRPEAKQRVRKLQQQAARRRMMTKVPTADVVIVNPTHFAVALKYDPKKMRAPRLVAKGRDMVAANIRRIAEEHRVPVFEAPKLARALYKSTDLDEEIPAGLYVAVAQVLSYLFRVRTLNPTLAARMARPDPKVGDEYADV